MDRLYSVWNIVRRYKYIVAIFIFLLIIGVIDENSWWVRHQRKAEIAFLEEQIRRTPRNMLMKSLRILIQATSSYYKTK